MSGAERAARYAFTPNSFGYCGTSAFLDILKGGDPELIENELKRFHPHFTYLSLIGRESGMEPFDEEVVEAFWIGNDLLEEVSQDSLRRFIAKELFPGGSPRARALADGLPEGLLPHHSMNALYVNFVTDKVERKIENYDSCCVSPAEVLALEGDNVSVRRHGIREGLVLEEKEESVLLERSGVRFIDSLEPGETVSVHWGMAIEKLSGQESRSLRDYTGKNLEALRKRRK